MPTVEAPTVMQNPGDVRLPEGVRRLKPAKKVLVLDGAAEVDPKGFDVIVPLPGRKFSPEAERQAINATTLYSFDGKEWS